MKAKQVTALVIAAVMSIGVLSGCSSKKVDADAVVAKMEDGEVRLGVANFMARYIQSSYDSYYISYFGEDYWSEDMSGDNTTMEESTKEQLIEQLETYYALAAHMDDYGVQITEDDTKAMEKAADQFIEANSKEAIEAMSANKKDIVEYLRLLTIQKRMQEAIEKDADTEVSDEEAAQRTYSYIEISTTGTTDENGETTAYTDEEISKLKTVAQGLVTGGAEAFESNAEASGYTISTNSYGMDDTADDSGIPEEVLTAANELKEGQMSGVIETESALYILRLDSEFDREATDEKKDEIVGERQEQLYEDVCEKYQKDFKFEVDKKVWATVKFEDLFQVKQAEEETENTTQE